MSGQMRLSQQGSLPYQHVLLLRIMCIMMTKNNLHIGDGKSESQRFIEKSDIFLKI